MKPKELLEMWCHELSLKMNEDQTPEFEVRYYNRVLYTIRYSGELEWSGLNRIQFRRAAKALRDRAWSKLKIQNP